MKDEWGHVVGRMMTSKTPVSQFLGSVAVVLYDKLLPPSSPISFSFSLPSPTLPSRRRKATSGTNTFSYLSETVSLNLELTQWARLAGEQASEICLAPHWHYKYTLPCPAFFLVWVLGSTCRFLCLQGKDLLPKSSPKPDTRIFF